MADKSGLRGGAVLAVLFVLLAACGGSANQAPATQAAAASAPGSWEQVVAAAKKEGLLLWSATTTGDDVTKLAQQFEQSYGIKVDVSYSRPVDFYARFEAELNAGKQATEVRTGGNPVMRYMDSKKWTEPIGELPVMSEAKDKWLIEPFGDIEAKIGNSPNYALGPYYIVVNDKLCPPDACVKSYKDLADPPATSTPSRTPCSLACSRRLHACW